MTEVKAFARRIRMSPKKVRLVANMVRGLDVSAAEAQLTFLNKAAARPVLKLIRSAKANAEHNFKLTSDGLYVKTIYVDGGPTLHRWIPRAHGRATPIRKRTSHITVILADRDGEAPKEISKAVVKKAGVRSQESGDSGKDSAKKDEKKTATKKPAAKKTAEKKEVKKAETKKAAAKKAEPKKAEAKSTKSASADKPAAKKSEKKDSGKDKKK